MSTQPQRDIIRDGFANIQANQSDAGKAVLATSVTEFKDRSILTQPTEKELELAFAENLFDLFRAMSRLPNAELEETPQLNRHFAFQFNPMLGG